MCTNVVVLCLAHPHFILQNFSHWSDSFPIAVGSNRIHFFGKQIIVFLFFKVPLVIHQVIYSIQILCLQILPCIQPWKFHGFDIDHCFPDFILLIQTIKNRNTQSQSHPIRTEPMIGRTGMKPMISLISISGKPPVSRQIERRNIAITYQSFLPLCQLHLWLKQLKLIEVFRQPGQSNRSDTVRVYRQ